MTPVSANTRRSSNAGLRMARRLRCRSNIKPTLDQPFVFAGQCPLSTNMIRRRLGQNLFIDIIIKNNTFFCKLNLHNLTFVKNKIFQIGRGCGLRVEGVVGRGLWVEGVMKVTPLCVYKTTRKDDVGRHAQL